LLLEQDAYQLDRAAVKKTEQKKEYAVSYLNSLNVRRRSQGGAGSMVSEAAITAEPRIGLSTASQVRYREVAAVFLFLVTSIQ
jgi:hypothetical protein